MWEVAFFVSPWLLRYAKVDIEARDMFVPGGSCPREEKGGMDGFRVGVGSGLFVSWREGLLLCFWG